MRPVFLGGLVSTGYGTGVMKEAGLLSSDNSNKQDEETRKVYPRQQLQQCQPNLTASEEDTKTRLKTVHALETVMPFVYVSNLHSASEWILEQHRANKDR